MGNVFLDNEMYPLLQALQTKQCSRKSYFYSSKLRRKNEIKEDFTLSTSSEPFSRYEAHFIDLLYCDADNTFIRIQLAESS